MIGLLKHTHTLTTSTVKLPRLQLSSAKMCMEKHRIANKIALMYRKKRKEKEDIANKLIGYLSQSLISH